MSDEKVNTSGPELLFELLRNSTKCIRLERTEHRGKELVVLREYFHKDGIGWLPTQKGINLVPENWLNLLPALQAAVEGA